MKGSVLYLYRLISYILPETSFFGLKRSVLRLAGAKIGNNVRICSSALFLGTGNLSIGKNTWVGSRSIIVSSSTITIGGNCDIAPNVYIGTGTHKITPELDRIGGEEYSMDIRIGSGCWLCVNSTILPGVTLGDKCVVAANALVTKSQHNCSFLVGAPAYVKTKIRD